MLNMPSPIIVVLLSLLFKSTFTYKQYCTKNEDCSKQLPGEVCSLCIGRTGVAKCTYPFPSMYVIDKYTLECGLNKADKCSQEGYCENDGFCLSRSVASYVCQCKHGYVGRNCQNKYDKLELFFVFNVLFSLVTEMCEFTAVKPVIETSEQDPLVDVTVLSEEHYYANAGYDLSTDYRHCDNVFHCRRTHEGMMRYSYKPYNPLDHNFVYIGERVFGYIASFNVYVEHKNTYIFSSKFKTYVVYPEKNICMPVIVLSECSVHYNKATFFTRLSNIRVGSWVKIVPNGNSLAPFGEKNKHFCEQKPALILNWKIWKIKARAVDSDYVVIQRFREESITIDPLTETLDFGFYRVELEAKTIYWGGSSHNFGSCYFVVQSLDLEPIIEGGTHRSVAKKDGLLLSAQNSKDPNQLPGDESIMAKWSCNAKNSSEVDITDMCKPVELKIHQPYFIPADILLVGEFIFTLEIWSDLYNWGYSSQSMRAKSHQFDYQTVTVTNKTTPLTNKTTPLTNKTTPITNKTTPLTEGSLLIECIINCGRKVNVNSQLILKVSYLSNTDGISFQWSYTNMESGKNIPVTPPDDLPSYIFEILEDTLDVTTNYTVTVSVTLNNVELITIYRFETDDFKGSVNCSVDPTSGIRGVTYFNIICSSIRKEPQVFEFYDKTLEEAKKRDYTSGKMLGWSSKGEVQKVIFTRGTLVVWVGYLVRGYWHHYNETYEINLTDNSTEQDALLYQVLHNPSYLRNMPYLLTVQYLSALPEIITNNMDREAFFNILLQNINPGEIKLSEDVRKNSLVLYNILSLLGKGNIDFSSLQKARKLVVKMIKVLKKSVFKNVTPNNLKDIIVTILNILELSQNVQDETEVDGTKKDIFIGTFLDLTESSRQLEHILDDVRILLSFLQIPGFRPTTISTFENTFAFNVLEDDTKYNYTFFEMVQRYPHIPSKLSTENRNNLTTNLKPEENLSLCVVVSQNIFKWFDRDTISDILIVSLSKRTKQNQIVNIHKISSPVDMTMYSNVSLPEVKEESQTIPMNPDLEEENPDYLLRVHRFDPIPGSKLIVTFLYPPTTFPLRVLISEDYRPTFKMMVEYSSLISEKSPYYTVNHTRTEVNPLYYMGVIPGPGLPLNEAVDFSFLVNSTTCMSWERVRWISEGCTVEANSSDHRVNCHCNHLSIFTAKFPLLPNKVDPFADFELFLTVYENLLVVSTMMVLFFLYVILSLMAFYMDKKDRVRSYITVLDDNYPHDKHPYLLVVYTSFRFFAGTSANVGIQLCGENSNSRAHILKSENYNVLKRHYDDWFLILCPKSLGNIQYLNLWHDNTGWGPGWYCNKVHVYDIKHRLEWLFIVEQWIELDEKNYPEVLVLPASAEDVLQVKRVLGENISTSVREQKHITGIFTQHPRSLVKRLQRVNIFMCTLLIALLFSIMFYIEPREDDFIYNMKTRDIYISLLTLLIIVSVNYVMFLLFSKSYQRVILKKSSSLYLRQSDFLSNYNPKEQFVYSSIFIPERQEHIHIGKPERYRTRLAQVIKNIMEFSHLAPATLPHGKSAIKVRKVWLALTWALCTTIIIVCICFITFHGLKMSPVKSKKWLTSLLISYANDAIVINPLSVLLLAAAITATFTYTTTSFSYRMTKTEIRMSVFVFRNRLYDELTERRQHPMYSPIKYADGQNMIKEKQKFLYRVHLLRLFLSLCYIVIVVTVVQQIKYLQYNEYSHLSQMTTAAQTSHDNSSFYNAYNMPKLKKYFNRTFLEVIFGGRWYNMQPTHDNVNDNSLYWTSDYSWKMVGAAYIRQLRVYDVPCQSFAPPVNVCVPYWSQTTEDTQSYSTGWESLVSPSIMKYSSLSPWSYKNPTGSWLKTYYRLQGESGIIYNSGGYEARIGSSIQETVATITHLDDHEWLGMFTRVLFLEMTLYNVNVHVLSQVTLMVEFLTTGVSLKAARITSVVDCNSVQFQHLAFIVLTLIFILEICHGINDKGFTQFFEDTTSILLVVIVIPSVLVIVAYLIHVYDCVFYDLHVMYYEKQNDYFDFDTLMTFHSNIVFVLSFLLLFGVARTLFLIRGFFQLIFKFFKLSLNIICFLLLLIILIFFIVLWQICFHSEIMTSRRIVDLHVSPEKHGLKSEDFDYDTAVFLLMKFGILTLLSSFYLAIFVHIYSTERQMMKTPKTNLPKIV